MENDKIQRLENIVEILCEIILDDARDRDASWHDCYDPLKEFLNDLGAERERAKELRDSLRSK